MVELSLLRKIAIYGAVGTLGAGVFMHHKIQRGLAANEFYQRSLDAVRNDERLVRSLGPPVRASYLNLASRENFVTEERAQLSIPIRGTRHKGHLHTRATRDLRTLKWTIISLEVEVNGKCVPVPFRNATDDEGISRP